MSRHTEKACYELALEQHGVLLRRQALSLGLTPRRVESRVSSGAWTRIRPGVFLVGAVPESIRTRLRAATLALSAVVSHESAAELHGIQYGPRGRAVVTVPVRKTYRFPGVVVHQATDLSPEWVITVQGLAVTTIERTVFDLAAVLKLPRLERVVDDCLAQRRTDPHRLVRTLTALRRKGKPGTKNLEAVLQHKGPGFVAPESELERRLLDLIRRAGLPVPVSQFPAPWSTAAQGRVDFAYPDAKLLIEVDGRRWHSQADAFLADRARDNLAQLAGWRVLRFTWQQVTDQHAEVVLALRQALGLAKLTA